ncbi:hypothetical protein AJ80_07018 [Polytolypa hystricis UAMH7299]|uniref:Uncharacterized protein n=1 Tax=Polytolypa hystricis (strain UAMH7299) TaxID=1447883 RepID=A0A2B7XTE0_POLH7|nr:hypothetical protein AJ80_07018 [Polytolypa hystricis UAMH7299]
MHLFSRLSTRLLGCCAAGLLLLACAGTTVQAASGNLEIDLIFPQNDTYSPQPIIPVAFAFQNSALAGFLQPRVNFIIYPYGNHTETIAYGYPDKYEVGNMLLLMSAGVYLMSFINISVGIERTIVIVAGYTAESEIEIPHLPYIVRYLIQLGGLILESLLLVLQQHKLFSTDNPTPPPLLDCGNGAMFNNQHTSHAVAIALYVFFACRCALSWASSTACAPHPIALRVGNVTLGNVTARGIPISVGTPPQTFAFLPQWSYVDTLLYGPERCTERWSVPACRAYRGGQYNPSASTTYKNDSATPQLDNGLMSFRFEWGRDTMTLKPNVSLHGLPIRVSRDAMERNEYHTQMAFSLKPNSTLLDALHTNGHIMSRSWSIFHGHTGRTSHLDGSFVFGGFDRAKTSGQNYTGDLIFSNPRCPTGMLVTITDIALNFLNGTNSSLLNYDRSTSSLTALAACIQPDLPLLMALPSGDVLKRFGELTHGNLGYFGYKGALYPDGMWYDNRSMAYKDDMSITLNSAFSTRIPNDQLVIPYVELDSQTGEIIHVDDLNELIISNATHSFVSQRMPQLGQQFLSGAYLMVNLDAMKFTLWKAKATEEEDVVAVDGGNRPVEKLCDGSAGGDEQQGRNDTPPSEGNGQATMSTGMIEGIVVGSVVGVSILLAGLAAYYFIAKSRKKRAQTGRSSSQAEPAKKNTDKHSSKDGGGGELHGQPRAGKVIEIAELP